MTNQINNFKVLIIGPFPPPISGVSLSNYTVHKYLQTTTSNIITDFIDTSNPEFEEQLGKFDIKKILFFISNYKLWKIYKSDHIYLTPGQTFFGLLKFFPFIIISYFLNKKIVVHIKGDYLWREYARVSNLQKKVIKYILSKAESGIVLSPLLRRNLTPFLPKKNIHSVFNFVEDTLFSLDIKDKIKNNFKELKIIFLSNLMHEKGIIDLLEALKILLEKKIPFTAQLAGNIESSSHQIRQYLDDLEKNITYLGVVSGQKKVNAYNWSNVFILPTYYRMEGQPISILEAMATGNIIITTKHAGIPDIFENEKNGYYIEKQNPNDIANKLILLSQNLDQYKNIAINNYHEARSKYTVDIFIKNIHQILAQEK